MCIYFLQPQIDEPLGSSQMFGTWVRGSNIKTSAPTPPIGNMYAALENMGNDVDKRSLISKVFNTSVVMLIKSTSCRLCL